MREEGWKCECEWWSQSVSYTVSGQPYCSTDCCQELAAFSNGLSWPIKSSFSRDAKKLFRLFLIYYCASCDQNAVRAAVLALFSSASITGKQSCDITIWTGPPFIIGSFYCITLPDAQPAATLHQLQQAASAMLDLQLTSNTISSPGHCKWS